jgi:GxxExxY protein
VTVLKSRHITDRILKTFYAVYNELGYGFLEKVYENAMVIELRRRSLDVSQQVPIQVRYDGQLVGDYVADLVVAGEVIVEVKAVEGLCQAHESQLLNYLKATTIEVGLLLNFGPDPRFIRRVFSNARKLERSSHPRESALSAASAAEGRGGGNDVEDAYNEG